MRLAVQKESTFDSILDTSRIDVETIERLSKELETGLCCAWGAILPFPYMKRYMIEAPEGNLFMSTTRNIDRSIYLIATLIEKEKLHFAISSAELNWSLIGKTITPLFDTINHIIENRNIKTLMLMCDISGFKQEEHDLLNVLIRQNIKEGVDFQITEINIEMEPMPMILTKSAALFDYLRGNTAGRNSYDNFKEIKLEE